MPGPVPTQPAHACPRCQAPLGVERRRATSLDGGMVCEPCQHEELEELLDLLEQTPPGPALPANQAPLQSQTR
jgi:hypothetical protein